MSRRWELPVLCWSLTIVRTVTSLIAIARLVEIKGQEAFFADSEKLVTVIETVSAINDVIIAIGLCYYLYKSRSGISGFVR